jgi:hypothetical protein
MLLAMAVHLQYMLVQTTISLRGLLQPRVNCNRLLTASLCTSLLIYALATVLLSHIREAIRTAIACGIVQHVVCQRTTEPKYAKLT